MALLLWEQGRGRPVWDQGRKANDTESQGLGTHDKNEIRASFVIAELEIPTQNSRHIISIGNDYTFLRPE